MEPVSSETRAQMCTCRGKVDHQAGRHGTPDRRGYSATTRTCSEAPTQAASRLVTRSAGWCPRTTYPETPAQGRGSAPSHDIYPSATCYPKVTLMDEKKRNGRGDFAAALAPAHPHLPDVHFATILVRGLGACHPPNRAVFENNDAGHPLPAEPVPAGHRTNVGTESERRRACSLLQHRCRRGEGWSAHGSTHIFSS